MLNYPLLYVEHLSEQDIGLIAGFHADPRPDRLRSRLVDDPELLHQALGSARLYEATFGSEAALPAMSPFLAFGVLVHRSRRDLTGAAYVSEWTAPGRRLPVFDVATLREFLDDGAKRYFLVELLASFTKVASGSFRERTKHGYRRRRFSELDPVHLADVVDRLPPSQRSGGYRRLGDVSLFLSGVFPDHTASHPLGEIHQIRLASSAGIADLESLGDDLDFHEATGAGWYRRSVDAAAAAFGRGPEHLLDVADHFREARRVLNYLADRYLYKFDSGMMRPA